MDAAFHQRLTDLYARVSELPESERRAVLGEACADDPELLREIESLLAADRRSHEWLDAGGVPLVDMLGATTERAPGDRIGRYTIERFLASGGAGDVYLARQARPNRAVAIKVMRHGLTKSSAKRRFEFEAELLARLDHPGIAQVFEADVFEDRGRNVPYFVMEYVEDARTLTEFASSEKLETRRRLEVFVEICEAVAHGHRQGIVHCDLKPANVLVHSSGRPRVIDFGIARALDRDPQLSTVTTGSYSVAGTLPYMSPEQVSGGARSIDQRTDVYALGVLVYELLTGRLPIDVEGRSIAEVARGIVEDEPHRLGRDDPKLRGDLETICAKALEKEAQRRYESAAELGADVRRFLNNEPILARRPTAFYQVRKFARRHRGLVLGAALALVALLVGSAVAVQQAILAKQGEAASVWQAYRASIAAAAAALSSHDMELARANLATAPSQHRNWEWRHLSARLDEAVWTVNVGEEGIPGRPVFWNDGGRALVSVLHAGSLSHLDVRTRELVDSEPARAFAHDRESGTVARIVASTLVLSSREGAQRRLDLEPLGAVRDFDTFALSPGAAFAVFGGADRVGRIELGSERLATTPVDRAGTGVASLDVSSDGRVVLAAGIGGRPALWDPGAASLRALAGVDGFARSVAFDAEGRRIAVGLHNASLGVWDAELLEPLVVRRVHEHAVTAVAFAGEALVSGSLDRTVRLWDPDELVPIAVLHGHGRGVRHVSWSEDENAIASTAEDGTLRLWDSGDLATDGELLGHEGLVFPVAFAGGGGMLASAGTDGTIRLWDPETHRARAVLPVPLATVTGLGFSPDGKRLIAAGEEGFVAFDLETEERLVSSEPMPATTFAVRDVEVLADSVRVLIPEDEGDARARTWNTTTGQVLVVDVAGVAAELTRIVDASRRFAVLYDSRSPSSGATRRADSDSGARLAVYDLRVGERLDLPPLSGAFAFHPTRPGRLAARLQTDPDQIGLFDLESGRKVGELGGHSDRIYDVAYAPDGSRLASCGRGGLRLWSTDPSIDERSRDVVELRGHRSFVWSVRWSPDGSQLATGAGDRTVRVWDTRPFAAFHGSR